MAGQHLPRTSGRPRLEGIAAMLTRRQLLKRTPAGALALALTARAFCQDAGGIPLRLANTAPFALPADFIGLGYEMSSVATPGLLSVANQFYVRMVQQLGSRGVLRVGGIVADFTRYQPDGSPVADMHNTVITRPLLEQFSAFLRKTKWTAIWSLNFAQGMLSEAVGEAREVQEVLGSSLLAFELGNEVENYAQGRTFRQAPYTYEQFRTEYGTWRGAILKAVPAARFAAPDTAGNVEWVERMAADAQGDVDLLTTHYYRNGQKQGSAEQLTHSDPKLLDKLLRLRAAAEQSRIPWRLCETNSFSGGGLPGVSDTLLGALWTLDFLCLLARYGCSGVNMETGINQLGFISSYSPVQDDGKGHNSAGVPYYGMLAFATARSGCTEAIPLEQPGSAEDLTAYAFGNTGRVSSLVLVNRSQTRVHVSIAGLGIRQAEVLNLTGSSVASSQSVTFGGATVDSTGSWSARIREPLRSQHLRVPAMSAIVVRAYGKQAI